MLDGLIRASIRHRLLVVLASLTVMVWGVWTALGLPVDVFPDLNRPSVTLMAEAGGLSPEEVEVQVTRPLEAAMNGAAGVERVRSQSAPGLAVVWVEFSWNTELRDARQAVAERLGEANRELPEGVTAAMGPVSSIMGEVVLVGLSSKELSGPRLRAMAETTVRPRLQAIPGVSQVIAIGGGLEEVHINVDPIALARFGLTLEQVEEAAAQAQGSSTGGFLERKSQELVVRNLARTANPERIADTVVGERDGVQLTLGQVATVTLGRSPMRGDAGVNGNPGVILSVQKQPGADTLAITADLEGALAELAPALGEGVETTLLFRQADFIEAAVSNVEGALFDGVVLVAIVLMAFLLNGRTTAITLTAIPLSFVVSALVFSALGLGVNTMTLGGLAVAIGELVDDAIVDVENVWRRLRENAARPDPLPTGRVVYEASREVRNSIVFSTLLVVLVFVPLFALSGIEGRLFAPLGVAYITAILASMAVSLTLTPALCSWLLPKAAVTANERGDGVLVSKLKAWDRRLLEWALPRPGLVMGVSAALALAAAASMPLMGRSFLPPFFEGSATVNLLAAPGTSLAESAHLGTLAERAILAVPEVSHVGRRTGRAERDEHAEGVHYTEIDVDFHEGGRPREEVLRDLRLRLAEIPGATSNLGQPISHRLDHLLSGVRAAIAVKVFGADLTALRASAAELAAALKGIPGLVDLAVESQVLVPQLQIEVQRDEARRYGLAPGALTETLEGAIGGRTVGQVFEGLRTLDVVVRYDAPWREDPARLETAPIVLPDGSAVPLGNLARIETGTGPNQVLHENGQRRVVISANTQDRDLSAVVADVRAAVAGVRLPEGAWTHVGGQFESQENASRSIAFLSLFSLLGSYALLYSHFRSHALTLQVLLNIPLALVGAVAAIWLSGQPLSVATLVGLVTLCGIATRNTILMISHYLHLLREEGMPMGPELVIRGSLERLIPVVMTALCAGLGLLPLAFAAGEPGKELLTPVAQVILGGLLSSTLMDMLVTPAAFLRFSAAAVAATPSDLDPLDS